MDRVIAESIVDTILARTLTIEDLAKKYGIEYDSYQSKGRRGKKLTIYTFEGDPKVLDRLLDDIEKSMDVENASHLGRSLHVAIPQNKQRKLRSEEYGPWILHWPPSHNKKIPVVKKVLAQTDRLYKKAGVRLSNVKVLIQGKGSNRSHYTSGSGVITLYPGSAGELDTAVHEVAHYIHDTMISGGYRNREIVDKYHEALRTKTDEGKDAPNPVEEPIEFGEWVDTTNNKNILMMYYKHLGKLRNKFAKRGDNEESKQMNDLANRIARRVNNLGSDAVTEGWFPIPYGRRNVMEFWATLATEVLINPNNVPKEAHAWVHRVLSSAK